MTQGDRLRRTLVNELPQATTIHWHGLRLPNPMDGVSGMTQDPVEPGASFDYDFTLPDAGTYWYHPHQRTYEQMARGLYGALIVEEPEGAPDVDADEVLLLDDWRLTEEAQIAGGFGALHDWAHAGRIGNWITVNGQSAFSHPVKQHARLRLRLVNVANARVFSLSLQGFEAHLVALDGMPLHAPAPVEKLTLVPAQRADLLVDVLAQDGEEALLISQERDSGFVLASFPVRGKSRASVQPRPSALPPNPVPALGPLKNARTVTLRMEGGAMGGMREARFEGRMTGQRELAQQQAKVWAFNGHVDMQKTPLIEAARGETVRIDMTNDTAWPHGMHLHGHRFPRNQQRWTDRPLAGHAFGGPPVQCQYCLCG